MPELRRHRFHVDWVVPQQLAVCAYPESDEDVAALAELGIVVLLNLDRTRHNGSHLHAAGLHEEHIPIRDFAAPTTNQIEEAVAVIEDARTSGQCIAVHCGAGLGRTGTIVACYLVFQGQDPETAVTRVRSIRPGSIETDEQLEAVYLYAAQKS